MRRFHHADFSLGRDDKTSFPLVYRFVAKERHSSFDQLSSTWIAQTYEQDAAVSSWCELTRV